MIFITPSIADSIAEKVWFPDVPQTIRDFKQNLQDKILNTEVEDIKGEIQKWYDNIKTGAEDLKKSVWDTIDNTINSVKTETENFNQIKSTIENNLIEKNESVEEHIN